jgi:hypothetical protein
MSTKRAVAVVAAYVLLTATLVVTIMSSYGTKTEYHSDAKAPCAAKGCTRGCCPCCRCQPCCRCR